MEYFEIGSCFNSYKELEEKLHKYCVATNTRFLKKDCRLIESSLNPMTKKNLMYLELKFKCAFKNFPLLKEGHKKFTNECPAYFRFKLVEPATVLQIVALNIKHNHPLELPNAISSYKHDFLTDVSKETAVSVNVELNVSIGQTFSTYSELKEAIYKTCNENGIQFYRRHSRKIASAIKRNSQKNYNPDIIYADLRYTCIHGGKRFVPTGTGIRRKRSFRVQCPAYVKASSSDDGQNLVIKEICNTHNHLIEKNKKIKKGLKRKNSIDENLNLTKIHVESDDNNSSEVQDIEFINVLIDQETETSVNFTFRGLCAPAFNAFNKDLTVDVSIIPKYAKFLADNGIKGVLVHGSTGEGTSLSVAERKLVTEEWAKAVKSTQQHLMIQVGGCPLPDVLDLARHAEQIGAGSILCLPELYFKPKIPAQLISYLKIVGAAAPKTPLLYYHVPMFSDVNLNMGQFLNESVGQIPTFCGIKYTSNDLDGGAAALRANNGKYAVFLGADTIMAGAFAMGFDSAIATTLNIYPQYAVNILKAISESKVEEAAKVQEQLSAVVSIITKNGAWVPTMKVAMNLVSPINVGVVRPPFENLSTEHSGEMEKSLKSISAL